MPDASGRRAGKYYVTAANYVHSVYYRWIGVEFVPTKYVNTRNAASRCKVFTHSLRLPQKSPNSFHSAVKDGIIQKFLAAFSDTPASSNAGVSESLFREDDELNA
jgi:hypothetical protein